MTEASLRKSNLPFSEAPTLSVLMATGTSVPLPENGEEEQGKGNVGLGIYTHRFFSYGTVDKSKRVVETISSVADTDGVLPFLSSSSSYSILTYCFLYF